MSIFAARIWRNLVCIIVIIGIISKKVSKSLAWIKKGIIFAAPKRGGFVFRALDDV